MALYVALNSEAGKLILNLWWKYNNILSETRKMFSHGCEIRSTDNAKTECETEVVIDNK